VQAVQSIVDVEGPGHIDLVARHVDAVVTSMIAQRRLVQQGEFLIVNNSR
jgi:hypothetical protein